MDTYNKCNITFIIFAVFLCSVYVSVNEGSESGAGGVEHGDAGLRAAAGDGFCERGDEACAVVEGSDQRLHRLSGGQVNEVQEVKLLSTGLKYLMKTVSTKPLVLEIKNFLSAAECQHFIELSIAAGLQQSETISHDRSASRGVTLRDTNGDRKLSLDEMRLTIEDSFDIYPDLQDIKEMYNDLKIDSNHDDFITADELGNTSPDQLEKYMRDLVARLPHKHSRFSKQAWLFPDQSSDQVFIRLQDRIVELTQLPRSLIKKSDFQVVNYGVGGHYNAHHDTNPRTPSIPCCTRQRKINCRLCRYMTILFYLNDVEKGGGTAFPLAGNDTYNEEMFRISGNVNLYNHCDKANLVVQPEKGKAVIWYNHFVDETTGWLGDLDEFTWHGGCPVIQGEKWIANFWIKTTDDKSVDLAS